MLYLCMSFPHLSLEARQPPADEPVAVTDRHGARRWVIGCNPACIAAGVRPGMDATTALALLPSLRLIERSRPREVNALKSLAAWAEQFSSWTCYDAERHLVWIEVYSGLRYFGGVEVIRSQVEHGLAQLGYEACCGVAPTLEAAAALARIHDAPTIEGSTDLAEALAPLPMAALALEEDIADAFAGLGLRTIGQVLALPRDSMARRFDPDLVDYLDRLTGRQRDPRKPFRAPAKFRRTFELLGNVETTEGLLFPLRRILGELQGYLIGRDTAVQELHLELVHDGAEPTRLQVRSSRPLRDGLRLFALVRERLERTMLPQSVEAITVAADQFVPLGDTQLELIEGGQLKDRDWEDLLDTLRARMGDIAVLKLGLQDQHLPEKAWCTVEGKERPPDGTLPDRPLWLLEPRQVTLLPQRMGMPERIEAGWWDGEDQQRDYFTAESRDGAKLWLYRDGATGGWFLHGLWA